VQPIVVEPPVPDDELALLDDDQLTPLLDDEAVLSLLDLGPLDVDPPVWPPEVCPTMVPPQPRARSTGTAVARKAKRVRKVMPYILASVVLGAWRQLQRLA
jgi:hypothetical protein